MESAQAKNQAPMDAGAIVPISFEALKSAIKETFEKLVSISPAGIVFFFFLLAILCVHFQFPPKKVEEGKVSPIKEATLPQIPEDLSSAIKSGKVRAPTHIISTISDDRGILMDTKP